MTADELLGEAGLAGPIPQGLRLQEALGLAYDSRKIQPGFLFFAFPGAKADGREFASQAIEKGAIGVVSELAPPPNFDGFWLQVQHGRKALALAAGSFYGHPDRGLAITGITGTNGKTTTAYLIDSIWRAAGKTTALIGTIEYQLAGRHLPAANTTPESLDFYGLLAELGRAGGTHVTAETSSHALQLGRLYGVQFDTAVFTNLTRDHLDFHGTMEAYLAAKQLLFTPRSARAPRVAVVNCDDPYGRLLQFQSGTEVFWYGFADTATARASNVRSTFDGLRFDLVHAGRTYGVQSPLIGHVNVYNLLAAWCTAFAGGLQPEVIAQGIESCRGVPGRFERVEEGQPFLVAVDYAHTDDALRNTIAIARNLTSGRVITLFGCGGDRDRTKRPLMGMAAAELSDLVVLTSDNPRSEDPLTIMNDALVGIRRFDTPLAIEPDREKAIRKAIENAEPGDVVILAGKGHETYQILGDRTIHFDDREVARAVLRGFGYERKGSEKA